MKALLLYTTSGDTYTEYPEYTSVELTLDLILKIKKATGCSVIITDTGDHRWLLNAYHKQLPSEALYKIKANHTKADFEAIFTVDKPYIILEIYNDCRE